MNSRRNQNGRRLASRARNNGASAPPLSLGLRLPATFRTGSFPPNPTRGKVYTFCEQEILPDISQLSGSESLGAYDFRLANLTNSASYTAIFDTYRIEKVEMLFVPYFNANSVGFATNTIPPDLFLVVDYDDATPAGSTVVLSQYSNMKCFGPTDTAYLAFRPTIATGVWDGASSTLIPAGTQQGPWLDIGSTGIAHYGVKYGVTANVAASTNTQKWHVHARITLQMCNQR